MRKIIIALCLFGSISVNAQANKNSIFSEALEIKHKEGNSFPSFVDFGKNSGINQSSFFNYLRNELGLTEEFDFAIINSNADDLGYTHTRYRLTINSIEVAYSNLSVHVKNGMVHSFNGNILAVNPLNTSSVITEQSALTSALRFVNATEYQWEIDNKGNPLQSEYYPEGKLVYLPNYYAKSDRLELVYALNIYASQPLSRQMIYVNAQDGSVIFNESLIHTGGTSNGIAVTGYSDTQSIVTDSFGSVFRMRDSTRGNGIVTLNCQQLRAYTGAIDFIDSNNFWNNFNNTKDQFAGDAQWGTEVTYDYFLNVHNRNSINDSGFALVSFMHYDRNYVNAFWNGQFMTYGDGNTLNGPLTALDIVGHEIAHGLTDFTSDLIYANESGALNESFSDIFGTAIEFNARPNRANWAIGEDIGGAFRSMSNPNLNNDPDTYDGTFWVDQNCIPTANNDRCGVHSNSGVQNYWFYLLVNGGIGVNDVADSFNVAALGMNKAEKIAFRNLTVYLNPSSNFNEARFYAIKSAIDLYGSCSPEVEATTNAWYAVGVGAEYVNFVSADFSALEDTAFCFTPVNLNFTSEGSNIQNFSWDFGNGVTSTNRNPSVIFQNQGSFTVELIADGGTCGADTVTKTNYIIIDPVSVPCSYLLDDMVNPTVSACNGRLYDSGGFGGNYGNDERGIFTISVPSADFIQLDFITLLIEAGVGFNCNKDFIEIYDGNSIEAPVIGRYCSNYLPPNNQIISSTNSVTIRMVSDVAANEDGFLIRWKCVNASNPPIADFTANVDSTCSGGVQFKNKSSEGFNLATWSFGDGTISNEVHPTHLYRNNGTFDVSLVVNNTVGNDTVIKSSLITVNKLSAPTVSNDTFCIGADAGLKVNPTGTAQWFRDTLVNSIFTGDSITVQNLQKDTTFYIKDFTLPATFTGAKMNNAGPGSFSNDNDYIVFDVYEPILLKNMILFSNKAGIRRLDLWSSQGELINSKEVYVPSSPLRVNINMEIYPDSNYRFSFSSREISLFKNTSGAVYPYDISNLVSIKGSNNAGEYPYFFRWQVRELGCESNFTTIKATIDTSCTLVGLDELKEKNSTSFSVQPNPFSNQLEINLKELQENNLIVTIYSLEGKLVSTQTIQTGNQFVTLNLDYIEPGIYYLNLIGSTINATQKIVKFE